MRLSALDITGFKSFARSAHLAFQEGTTAIVGPNGSGKSNIADAVRWVLGEQSMKTLRGKKSEDVIFSGSGSRGRLGMAEVSLTLSNTEDDGPVDAAELVITRQLTRSGESIYLLNRRPVRLADVADILARAGFGQKTYTVIGQGMADAFVNASPTERRAMFEDATGVTPLLLKKEQTERKLEQTKEHMVRAKDLLRELEPRLRSLKRQASRVRSRQELEEQLRAAETAWYTSLWQTHTAELRSAEETIRITGERSAEIVKRMETLRTRHPDVEHASRLPELRAAIDHLQREEQEILLRLARTGVLSDDHVDRIAEERVAREKERQRLLVLLADAERTMRAEETALHMARTTLRELQESLLTAQDTSLSSSHRAELQRGLTEMVGRCDTLIERLQSAESMEELPELADDAEELRQLLHKHLARIQGTGKETETSSPDDLRKRLETTITEEQHAMQNVTRVRTELSTIEARLRVVTERLTELERMPSTSHTDVASGDTARLEELRQQLAGTRAEAEQLESALVRASAEQQQLQTDRDTLQEQLRAAEHEQHTVEVAAAGTRARLEDLEHEVTTRLGDALLTELRATPPMSSSPSVLSDLETSVRSLRERTGEIGSIDEGVLQEEAEVEQRVVTLRDQLQDLERASADLRDGIRDLTAHIHRQFSDGLKQMHDAFNTYFRQIFGGGRAGLNILRPRLVEHALPDVTVSDADNAEEAEDAAATGPHTHELPAGVEIRATPPGKKLTTLSQLSGGEKALTSIALLFAILSQRPSPFVVLDEVDAALDESNSRRFARMLRELARTTQFLVITHNRATMEAASALYGVTMGEEGISQLFSLRLSDVPDEMAEQRSSAHSGEDTLRPSENGGGR